MHFIDIDSLESESSSTPGPGKVVFPFIQFLTGGGCGGSRRNCVRVIAIMNVLLCALVTVAVLGSYNPQVSASEAKVKGPKVTDKVRILLVTENSPLSFLGCFFESLCTGSTL